MPSFFSNLADKAQSAINASPLAGKLPLPHTSPAPRPGSPESAPQPSANEAAAQGGQRNHALEALSYQFRAFQQQYSSTSPVQKIITAEKGLALDFENVSRESQAQSKELYTWGQSEPEDLKDVTDRLAYLNSVHGSLAGTLSQKLDAARAPFKALRGAESTLQPRRAARATIETQLSRVENDPRKAVELRELLKKAELEDSQHEKDVEVLKRKAVKDSEQIKWAAIQEYAEKVLLLSQAAAPLLTQLPAIPPSPTSPYNGGQTTGAIRAALQQALDHHQPGTTRFDLPSAGVDLSRSDTRSFGESHAAELSKIPAYTPPTPHPDIQVASGPQTPQFAHFPTPAPAQVPSFSPVPIPAPAPTQAPAFPTPQAHAPPLSEQSHPIDPLSLNQTPALIPSVGHSYSPPAPLESTAAPVITPTIAETGLPLSAGASGPGPARGSLHDLKNAATLSGVLSSPPPWKAPPAAPAPVLYESAEDEKKRLAARYSQAHSSAPNATPAASTSRAHETAEEEKKRLEREERERILRGQQQTANQGRKDGEPEEDLPPYQEPTLQ